MIYFVLSLERQIFPFFFKRKKARGGEGRLGKWKKDLIIMRNLKGKVFSFFFFFKFFFRLSFTGGIVGY